MLKYIFCQLLYYKIHFNYLLNFLFLLATNVSPVAGFSLYVTLYNYIHFEKGYNWLYIKSKLFLSVHHAIVEPFKIETFVL